MTNAERIAELEAQIIAAEFERAMVEGTSASRKLDKVLDRLYAKLADLEFETYCT